MGYELRYAHGLDDEIAEFVLTLDGDHEAIVDDIDAELARFGQNPARFGSPSKDGDPFFLFHIDTSAHTYAVRIHYYYASDEKAVILTSCYWAKFSP